MCNNYLGLNCKLYYLAYIAFVNPSCICNRGNIYCSNKGKCDDDDDDDRNLWVCLHWACLLTVFLTVSGTCVKTAQFGKFAEMLQVDLGPVRGHPFMTSTKKQVFEFLTSLPLSTCVHMGRTPLPLVDVQSRSTWNKHRSLEMASTMAWPKAEIRLYDSNLFKLY